MTAPATTLPADAVVGPEGKRQSGRLVGGDALRAVAALMVLVHHLWLYSGLGYPWDFWGIFFSGRAGVFFFFTLSGFLLYRPFASALAGGKPVQLARYARARITRVFPAYLVALLCIAAINGFAGLTVPQLFLLQSLQPTGAGSIVGPAWSLSIEVLFYATLPLLFLLFARTPRRLHVWILVGLAGASWLLRVSDQLANNNTSWIAWSYVEAFWVFLPGMLIAHMSVNRPAWFARLADRRLVYVGLDLFIFAVLFMELRPVFAEACLLASTFCLLPALLSWNPQRGRAAASRLAWAGAAFSYAVYLWHEPIIRFLAAHGITGVANIAIALTLTGLAAYLSYRFIETPTMRRTGPLALPHYRWLSWARARLTPLRKSSASDGVVR